MPRNKPLLEAAGYCLEKTLSKGADASDVIIFDSADVSVAERLGKPESIERSETKALGVRAFIDSKKGYKQAIISTNDISHEAIDHLVDKVVSMAKESPADPYIGLAKEDLLTTETLDLNINDSFEPSAEDLKEWAAEAEESALQVKGVTNSDGADAAYSKAQIALVTSNGFAKQYSSTSFSVSTSVIAGEGTAMETDYDYSISRNKSDLKSPKEIGKKAGELAVRRLNPKKVKTCQVPLIFDTRIARGLLKNLAEAVIGNRVARGTSFLKDKMGEQVFAEGINIIDDPHRLGGLGSEPFDAEGVRGEKLSIIKDGVLSTWLLDLRSAKRLGLKTTGHASRDISSTPSPSPSNFYLEAGKISKKDLMSDIKSGFYVTEAFGMGINNVTGDYSQGASGFWIENGEIAFPVSEMTIAGNLKDMFKNLTPANDLEFIYRTNSPTLRIEGMTVAGV